MKDAVDSHRTNLRTLEQLISNISSADAVSLDENFENDLKKVRDRVNELADKVKNSNTGGNLNVFEL